MTQQTTDHCRFVALEAMAETTRRFSYLTEGGTTTETWALPKVDTFHGRVPYSSDFAGTPKRCFDNAQDVVMESDDYTYVEGFAFSADADGRQGFLLVHHAWVLDPDDEPIEVTWRHGGFSYAGIRFSRECLEDLMDRQALASWPFVDTLTYMARLEKYEWLEREGSRA